MLRVRGITHDRATIQSLPSRSREMDRHEIPFIAVACKQDRMRHCSRCGARAYRTWSGLIMVFPDLDVVAVTASPAVQFATMDLRSRLAPL